MGKTILPLKVGALVITPPPLSGAVVPVSIGMPPSADSDVVEMRHDGGTADDDDDDGTTKADAKWHTNACEMRIDAAAALIDNNDMFFIL